MKFPAAIAAFLVLTLATPGQHTYRPKEGYVPNAETAVKVAEAVLSPVYGKAKIASERPFVAKLRGGVWRVEGTMHTTGHGGVALVEISKSDGQILRMTHGK
jgi:hypothetical protein